MTTIISFVNQKGGVGKSTSVINVAASLCHPNNGSTANKVLIIDMDPQANTTQVYSNTTDNDASIYNLLMDQAQSNQNGTSISSLKQSTYIPNLDILPSNVLLSSAEIDLVNSHSRETVLKRLLKTNTSVLKDYDYVLIDCQPSLGLLTINAIIASDYLMVPIQASAFSLTGLEQLTQTVEKLQRVFEIDCTILGFFFTQINKQEALYKEAQELCTFSYGPLLFNTAIRNNVSIDHANATDQSILSFDPDSPAAQDYESLTSELLEKIQA